MYRLSADQMGGATTSTIDVTTNSTVMLSFLHWWVIPQYIVLAPTRADDVQIVRGSYTCSYAYSPRALRTTEYQVLRVQIWHHTLPV